MTLSIVARCPRQGLFGVAALTEMPAVGKLLSHARAGVGAAATQAKLNPYLGIDALRLMGDGASASDALSRLVSTDPRGAERQFAVVDAAGITAAWTGSKCPPHAGSIERQDVCVSGNRLAGPHVLEAMVSAYEDDPGVAFDERLIRVIEAAERAGGDRKGERSANLLIVSTEEYPLWDIRVDEHDRPVAELRRLHDVFKTDILPQILTMPTRENPAGGETEAQV